MLYAAPGTAGAKIAYQARYDNFIGGSWLAPVKGQYFDVITPISGRPYTQVARSTTCLLYTSGPVGKLTQSLGLGLLPFTFPGLVIASLFYSLPFVVQPIQNAFEAIGERPLELSLIHI